MKYPNIKSTREKLGLTQQDVAVAAGMGLRHYQTVEAGKTIPGVTLAGKIAKALKTTVDHLWEIGGSK